MQDAVNYQALGEEIKRKRKKLRLTRSDLAEKVYISVSHMYNIETANSSVSLEVIVRIANALDTTLDCLLKDSLINYKSAYMQEYYNLLDDCEAIECKMIVQTVTTLKGQIKGFKSELIEKGRENGYINIDT